MACGFSLVAVDVVTFLPALAYVARIMEVSIEIDTVLETIY